MLERLYDGFVPGRHLIEAFGNGGFRFADMSHRGSILALPSGVRAWAVETAGGIDADSLAEVIAAGGGVDVLLVGTGQEIVPLPASVREHLRANGVRVDVMTTWAAAQTYNIMAVEDRPVAAALIAVP